MTSSSEALRVCPFLSHILPVWDSLTSYFSVIPGQLFFTWDVYCLYVASVSVVLVSCPCPRLLAATLKHNVTLMASPVLGWIITKAAVICLPLGFTPRIRQQFAVISPLAGHGSTTLSLFITFALSHSALSIVILFILGTFFSYASWVSVKRTGDIDLPF